MDQVFPDCGPPGPTGYYTSISTREENENSGGGSDQNSDARRAAALALEELLVCADAFNSSTSPSSDPEKWFRAESESLLRWAEHTGRLLSEAELSDLISGFKFLEGGLEHEVHYRRGSGRIFKITKPPYFGQHQDMRIYVQNLIWCNAIAGNSHLADCSSGFCRSFAHDCRWRATCILSFAQFPVFP